MRYLIQFAVPLLILALVTWGVLSARRKRAEQGEGNDGSVVFLLILAIGAAVAVALFILMGDWLVIT